MSQGSYCLIVIGRLYTYVLESDEIIADINGSIEVSNPNSTADTIVPDGNSKISDQNVASGVA